ncbi:unnamed protein product [Vitrella brassicaformis CCMP3155]|uniref:Uncharacterized protein n=1 Tax=Vitrella brassicaformis (strain CCMP3155) TaxID=1169540 RepID=A0A0G4E895_VITBC|nr:unnamed protein product [Vitrella brassicaformis CCMP3155]|eukprot:CEL91866.1 unnamed protein product [Vitrella brassicaformis CCMP3155]
MEKSLRNLRSRRALSSTFGVIFSRSADYLRCPLPALLACSSPPEAAAALQAAHHLTGIGAKPHAASYYGAPDLRPPISMTSAAGHLGFLRTSLSPFALPAPVPLTCSRHRVIEAPSRPLRIADDSDGSRRFIDEPTSDTAKEIGDDALSRPVVGYGCIGHESKLYRRRRAQFHKIRGKIGLRKVDCGFFWPRYKAFRRKVKMGRKFI